MVAATPKKMQLAKNQRVHSCLDQDEVGKSYRQHKSWIHILQMEVQNDININFSYIFILKIRFKKSNFKI